METNPPPTIHYLGFSITEQTKFQAVERISVIMDKAKPGDMIVFPEDTDGNSIAWMERVAERRNPDVFGSLTFRTGPQEGVRTVSYRIGNLVGAKVILKTDIALRDKDGESFLDRESGIPIPAARGKMFAVDDLKNTDSGAVVHLRCIEEGDAYGLTFYASLTQGPGEQFSLSLDEIPQHESWNKLQSKHQESGTSARKKSLYQHIDSEHKEIAERCRKIRERFPVLLPITHFSQDNKGKEMDGRTEQEKILITPEKRQNDYRHFTGGLRANPTLEDLIYAAYEGKPSADIEIMVHGVRQSANYICQQSEGGVGPVQDVCGVLEYAQEIEKLYTVVLGNMKRGQDSCYHFCAKQYNGPENTM